MRAGCYLSVLAVLSLVVGCGRKSPPGDEGESRSSLEARLKAGTTITTTATETVTATQTATQTATSDMGIFTASVRKRKTFGEGFQS